MGGSYRSVSIPIGFSSSLQHFGFRRFTPGIDRFQSLSGFQVRCNLSYGLAGYLKKILFQSLSGFQVRCNVSKSRDCCSSPSQFQSLSGFQVRCNTINGTCLIGDLAVSIPIGFSSSLQRICYVGLPENTDKVSIPIGFSSSLQRLTGRSKSARSKSFNPYRVFKFVATQFVVTTSEKPNGFNPYRVFKFVATQPSRSRTGLTSLFQSLSGFQVRCNIEDPIFFDREEAVSIPIGFSSSLQRHPPLVRE